MLDPFVTEAELVALRSADKYLPWVLSKLRQISKTEGGRQAILLSEGLVKKLREEALPLAFFGHHFFEASPHVTFNHLMNEDYDANVFDDRPEPSPIKFIEVTQAHEGNDGYLRDLLLLEQGHVHAFGPVHKSGTKKTGRTLSVESIAAGHIGVRDDEFRRIGAAGKRKENNLYLPGTALLLSFDDALSINHPGDVPALDEFVHKELIGSLTQFCCVAVIGTAAGRVCRVYGLDET